MKANGKGLLIGLLISLVLTGCGGGNNAPANNAQNAEDNTTESSQENTANEKSDQEKEESNSLSEEDLSKIEEDLSNDTYYGFLLSEYDDPKNIDLNQVFYNGAGMELEDVPEDMLNGYLKLHNEDELELDAFFVEKSTVDSFIKEATGYSYDEMTKPSHWDYLNEYDVYVTETGDTNRTTYKIISGTKDGELYSIRYARATGSTDDSIYEITFKTNDGKYQFLSNRSMSGNGSSNNEPSEDTAKSEDGVYGFWDQAGTCYQLSIDNSQEPNHFTLQVVRFDGPSAYLEGNYVDNSNGTRTATITYDEFYGADGDTFEMVPTEDGFKIESNNDDLKVINGEYPFVGDYEALERLSPLNNSDYIIPNSDTREITYSDLILLSDEQLCYARNEIYARHGRKFKDSELQSYFNNLPWYNGTIEPDKWSDNLLNEYEKHNVQYIMDEEASRNNENSSTSSIGPSWGLDGAYEGSLPDDYYSRIKGKYYSSEDNTLVEILSTTKARLEKGNYIDDLDISGCDEGYRDDEMVIYVEGQKLGKILLYAFNLYYSPNESVAA